MGRYSRPYAVPHGEMGVPEGAPRSGEPTTRGAQHEILSDGHQAASLNHSARNSTGVL